MKARRTGSNSIRTVLAFAFLVSQLVIPAPTLATDRQTVEIVGTIYVACSQKPTYDPSGASATISFGRPFGSAGETYPVEGMRSWQWDAAKMMWRTSYRVWVTEDVDCWTTIMSLTYTDTSEASAELQLLSPQTGRKVTFTADTTLCTGVDFIFNHYSWEGVRHCGTIFDRHGRLLTGKTVEVDAVRVGTGAEYSTASSGSQSFYSIAGLSGAYAYDLSAKHAGYDLVTVPPLGVMRNTYRIPTNPGNIGALIYDFNALALCPIGVHVFDYDRIEGVRCATVELWYHDRYDGGMYKMWAGPIKTGEDGHALFNNVPEGKYDLKVYKDDYAITPDEPARNPVDLDIEALSGYLQYRADFFAAPRITDILMDGDSYVVVWNDNTTVESSYQVLCRPTGYDDVDETVLIETTDPLDGEMGHRSPVSANLLVYDQYDFYVEGYKDTDDGPVSVRSNIVTVDVAGGSPELSISASPTSGASPLAVAFKSVTKNFAPTTWRWYFGDEMTSNEPNPTCVFNEGGTFRVTLTVTGNRNGEIVHEDAAVDVTVTDPGPVHARFSALPTTGANPLEVTFIDQSMTDTGSISSREWDFDNDGIVDATGAQPTHTYSKGGIYTVRLTVGNGTATDTAIKTDYIKVNSFVADFGANPTTGALPLAVAFSNTTIGTVTHCEWDFGDGSPLSNEANPVHTYTTAGTYDVSFTAGGPNGESDSIKRWNYITVTDKAKPTASFTANPYGGQLGQDDYGNVIPVTVQFADTSTAPTAYPITAWAWNFGNGSTSTSRNPGSVSYETAGVYHVTLTVTNSQGQDTADRYLTILGIPGGGGGGTGGGGGDLPLPPEAYFYGSPTRGRAPLTVTFHDQSTNGPTSWSWNFGDGALPSTEQNPTHTYTAPGTYTVILSATNGVGSDTETKAGYIVVGETPPLLTAAFETLPDPARGDAPLAVHFIDRSTPRGAITSWAWDFGDGSPVATEVNPAHTYTTVGPYPVTLTVTHGIEGEPDYASATAAGTVVVTGNRPPELAAIGNKNVNENATLTITLSGSDLDGDPLTFSATGLPSGATFNASTKTFTWKPTYTQAGAYPVTFAVSDGKASDSETITITVANVNRAPATGSIAPASGTGSYTTFTTTFSDPDGAANIKTARLLINTATSSLNCVYMMYDQTNDSFYLCKDTGSATGWLGPIPRTTGAYTTLANSYGKLRLGPGSNTTVTKSGTTLTVTWDVEFLPLFKSIGNTSPTKNMYLYTDDMSGAICSWGSRKGTWTIPNIVPAIVSLTPTSGGMPYTTSKVFQGVYSDKNGYGDIRDARFLINTQVSSYKTVYVKYEYSTNKLYLCKDNDPDEATRWLGGYAPGTAGAVIENSQGKLDCGATTVAKSGETLTIRWRISFKEAYRGTKKTYLYMTDKSGATAGWVQKGTWTIQ